MEKKEVFVVYVHFTDNCTYSHHAVCGICDNEVSAIEIEEDLSKEYPDNEVYIEKQEMNKKF